MRRRAPSPFAAAALEALLIVAIACRGGREGAGAPRESGAASQLPRVDAADEISVTLAVRDGGTGELLPASRWRARLEPVESEPEAGKNQPPAPAGAAALRFEPTGPTEAAAGHARAGIPYALTIEATGFARLGRVVRLRAGVPNRIEASLDRAPDGSTGG